MGWFSRGKESRAREPDAVMTAQNSLSRAFFDVLSTDGLTRNNALEIPAVKGCIEFIAATVSMLPVYLFRREGINATRVDDSRVRLLNDDPRDTLDASQFWRALVYDYFINGNGYAYVNRVGNAPVSLHFVEARSVSVFMNHDPIFKGYYVNINGRDYEPWEFVKILRDTKDGATGLSIIEENRAVLSVALQMLIYERATLMSGGNKKGLLTQKDATSSSGLQSKLSEKAAIEIQTAISRLFNKQGGGAQFINTPIDFYELSNSPVDMQLNQIMRTVTEDICRLFGVPSKVISGGATDAEYRAGFKMAVMPVLSAIERALNRVLLLESEKGEYFFEFDKNELLKADAKERFLALETAIKSKLMTVDEARATENLPPLGVDFIAYTLADVFYYPDKKLFYVPNKDGSYDAKSSDDGMGLDSLVKADTPDQIV